MGRLGLVTCQRGWAPVAGCESFPVWIPGGGGGRPEGERLFWLVGPQPLLGRLEALIPQLPWRLPIVEGAQYGN